MGSRRGDSSGIIFKKDLDGLHQENRSSPAGAGIVGSRLLELPISSTRCLIFCVRRTHFRWNLEPLILWGMWVDDSTAADHD